MDIPHRGKEATYLGIASLDSLSHTTKIEEEDPRRARNRCVSPLSVRGNRPGLGARLGWEQSNKLRNLAVLKTGKEEVSGYVYQIIMPIH